jgi:hypothetical protein
VRRVLVLVLLAVSVTGAAQAAPAGAEPPDTRTSAYGARSEAPKLVFRAGQAPAGFTGGPITAASGETVTVYVQDELLAADPNANQHWADVVAGLLHGAEISDLTIYMATLDLVSQRCGQGALGCYGNNTIFALGEDIRGVSAQSVLTHEYGHHVAAHQLNDPWQAVDWGTKRWATHQGVCARSRTGELVPGDEGRFYEINPGEVFAEDYRVLNERRAGLPEASWDVVDQRLYPDQQALDLLAQDVTSPWAGATTATYTSSLGPRATGRGFRVSTPLDGNFTVTLTGPAKATLALRLVDPSSGSVLASDVSSQRVKTVGTQVCGQRTVWVQVKRLSGSGAFTLSVSTP